MHVCVYTHAYACIDRLCTCTETYVVFYNTDKIRNKHDALTVLNTDRLLDLIWLLTLCQNILKYFLNIVDPHEGPLHPGLAKDFV